MDDYDGQELSAREVSRLLAAIFPTKFEERLMRLTGWCYRHENNKTLNWIGDRADDVRVVLQRRRARRGKVVLQRWRARRGKVGPR